MVDTTVTTYAEPWVSTLLPAQYFGRGRVTGLHYQNGPEVAWHVTWEHPQSNPPHDYWVNADGTFHTFASDNKSVISLTKLPSGAVSSEEHQAITEAIAEWNSPT